MRRGVGVLSWMVVCAACGGGPPRLGVDEAMSRADSLAEVGDPRAAAELLASVARTEGSARAAFSAAGYFASEGASNEALAELLEAAELGFDRPLYLTNPDFDPLHDEPEWAEIQQTVDANYVRSGVDGTLYALFQEDQADRLYSGDPIEAIEERDGARITRVHEVVDAKTSWHAHDFLHAAMVLHHSHDPADNLLAVQLADSARARPGAHPMAGWLSAATRDRYQMRIGEPQWYGTQMVVVGGESVLDPASIDTTAVSDADRAAHNVASLADIRTLMARFDTLSVR